MATSNNLTNYGADQTAAWWAGKTWYAALMTTKTSKTVAGVEVNQSDYARQSVTLSAEGGGTHGIIWNGTQINFGTPLEDWGTVQGITLYDQLTGGNAWMFFDLAAGVDCAASAPVSIPVNQLVETLT
ncbi:MAG: hypothetical protein WCP21_24475 [Armatimonadota bacterium]